MPLEVGDLGGSWLTWSLDNKPGTWGFNPLPTALNEGNMMCIRINYFLTMTWPLIGWAQILYKLFNTLRPRQNGRHFPDGTFKRIFLNENARVTIEIWLKFIPKGPINNIPAFVQIMAWRRPGDKPLSEPIAVRLPTHICVTRPQWVKPFFVEDSYCSELVVQYPMDADHLATIHKKQ